MRMLKSLFVGGGSGNREIENDFGFKMTGFRTGFHGMNRLNRRANRMSGRWIRREWRCSSR